MRGTLLVIVASLLLGIAAQAELGDYLLPNGEPIVGVYYYSWFGGEPYRHVGWTPEFEYDNRNNDGHIYEVIKAMTDYGINQASYSYWDNEWYLQGLGRHLNHAQKLLAEGRPCYFSPYLEPRTIDKLFATPEAQQANSEFISTYLDAYGKHPAFCKLGDTPFTNIYVTYYRPDETDAQFRTFLSAKYGSLDALRAAWTAQPGYEDQMLAAADVPDDLDQITLGVARPGTVAHADRQQLRARRLRDGWLQVIRLVDARTGMPSRYTGDVSRTIVSPTRYMEALTGMSWYSFGYALTNPTRRPKLISEVAKYTDTTFLNTISPGYVDRQQRWTGGRVEREPFHYPYAWVKAIQALPEGIMILTHSEWFEGSIIDVTKEYGKADYETTELYSSVFRAAFESIYTEKRDTEPIAIVFNEWATYGINEGGTDLEDVYGLIKLLECLNLEYDIIPESALSAEELAGRRLVLVPNCGLSLAPGNNEILLAWARSEPGALLVVDESKWWAAALGVELGDGGATILRYRCSRTGQWVEPIGASFEGLRVRNLGTCEAVGETEGDAPKILNKTLHDDGRGVLFFNGRLGKEFHAAFMSAAQQGRAPVRECRSLFQMLEGRRPRLLASTPQPPNENFQVKAGPVLTAGDTKLLPAGNVLPWGYIADHRAVGWGLGKGHSAEDTQPWDRATCFFSVPVQADQPVAEVMAIDSDAGRFMDLPFGRDEGNVTFKHAMKFQAMFAIVQSPVKLICPQMTISPGRSARFTVQAVNLTDAGHECALSLRRTPGLSMAPVGFAVEPGKAAAVQVVLVAGTDYASGDRTLVFDLQVDGRTASVWRPIHCTLPACIGTRTALMGGPAGAQVTRQVTLVNVGQAPAEDVRLTLADGQASVPDLAPGDEQTVPITFMVPRPARAASTPDISAELSLGDGGIGKGLSTRSVGDGTTESVQLARRRAIRSAQGPDQVGNTNAMIYLWVDDAVLPPGDYGLEVELEYFDQGNGSFMVEYDSTYGDGIEDRYRDSRRVSLMDTGTWKSTVIGLKRARLGGRQNFGADLRINGHVAVCRIALRGRRPTDERIQHKMRVDYKQFGHAMSQELDVTMVSLAGTADPLSGGPTCAYGAVPSWALGRSPATEGLTVTDRLQQQALLITKNTYLEAVWDSEQGGLVSLSSKRTGADYAAFPGPMIPVMISTADGETHYIAPGEPSPGGAPGVVRAQTTQKLEGGDITIEDAWTVWPGQPRITLNRRIVPHGELKLADFAPAVVRLTPEYFDQVMPLGVGFGEADAPGRGWLETWYSEGWYFAFSGDPSNAGHGVAVTVRAETISGNTGLKRFQYGFFPGDGLPGAQHGVVAKDELQIRLRGHKRLSSSDRIHITMDVYLIPGGSYTTARHLALLGATPGGLEAAWTPRDGDWSTVQGTQTIVPTAPVYMFSVRQPYYSASLEGDR